MRIIVTGASGAIGRAVVPRLVTAGHDVVGLFHHDHSAAWLRGHGAEPRRVDLFDPAQVAAVLRGADAVVHLATAIPPVAKSARARRWALNDRLRAEATRVIVDIAEQVGVGRAVVGSITFHYVDRGDHWITEDDPVSPVFRPTASAVIAEERVARFAATGASGIVLRFGQLYGPGRVSAGLVDALRARQVPLVGTGNNYVPSIHVEDAGAAVAAALGTPSGIYNACDDQPMRAGERLELMARIVDAPTPRRVPAGVARVVAGKAVHLLTASHRVLNRRLRDTTGWTPRHPSVREGWQTVLDPEPSAHEVP